MQDKYNTIQKLLKKTAIQFDSHQMEVTQNVVTRFYNAGKVIARPQHISIVFIGGGSGEAGGLLWLHQSGAINILKMKLQSA